MNRDCPQLAHPHHAFESLGEEVTVEDDRVTADGELDGSRGNGGALHIVLMRRLGSPRVDPTAYEEPGEVIRPNVNAEIEGGSHEPTHCRFANSRWTTDDENGRNHEITLRRTDASRICEAPHQSQPLPPLEGRVESCDGERRLLKPSGKWRAM